MKGTASKDYTWAGVTPGSTLTTYRNVILRYEDINLSAKYLALRFYNAEAVASALKVIVSTLGFTPAYRKEDITPAND